jgi:uncharacterized membrane protein
VDIRLSLVACAFCYLGGLMDEPGNEPMEERRRLNRFQQFAVILLGVMMILTGLATIFEGPLFSPYFPAAALFAPFALAGGALVIALAIRAGRRN